MDIKIIAGILASLLAIAAVVPYIVTTLRGQTKPHLFSWLIWTLLNVIGFCAQIAGGAGPGAWVTAMSGILSLFLSALTYKLYKAVYISRADWISFVLALSAIPVWMITKEPLMAAIIVSLINIMAYIPTVRKAWKDHSSENILSFILHASKCVAGIAAMSAYTPTTLLYPLTLLVGNLTIISTLILKRVSAEDWRRRRR
jgi:hypothetical protein